MSELTLYSIIPKSVVANISHSHEFEDAMKRVSKFTHILPEKAEFLRQSWYKLWAVTQKVWTSIATNDLTFQVYNRLHQDFQYIFNTTFANMSQEMKDVVQILSLKVSARDTDILYERVNADFPGYNISDFIAYHRPRFKTWRTTTDVTKILADKDVEFVDVMARWRQRIDSFMDQTSITPQFYR